MSSNESAKFVDQSSVDSFINFLISFAVLDTLFLKSSISDPEKPSIGPCVGSLFKANSLFNSTNKAFSFARDSIRLSVELLKASVLATPPPSAVAVDFKV